MKITIPETDLRNLIEGFSYLSFGDKFEHENQQFVIDKFINSEKFWKYFITPITKRIDNSIPLSSQSIYPRENIDLKIREIASLHYSIFRNLVYANNCLGKTHLSFFENFYTHLGSICDLAEEFITQLYFICLNCSEKETEVLQYLSKNKFLKIASSWYDENYNNTYTHYLSKGKVPPIKIIGRPNILDEYFGSITEWKEFKNFMREIRTYRNVVVHNTIIANITTRDGYTLVPKKEKIQNYKKWHQVEVAALRSDPNKLSRDFITVEIQMQNDFNTLKEHLNKIWGNPINDFYDLIFIQQNKNILRMYDIELS